MPAKDLNAKQRCLLGLTLVAILATVMFLSSPLMVGMGITLAALALLVVYIVFNLSVHWVDVAEAIDYRQTQNRYTARIDRYRLSLSALPEGVVLFRQGNTLEWCNPAAERHLGIKLTEHLGKGLREVFSNEALVSYLEAGDFVHTLGDAHIYTNHFEQVQLQMSREPRPLPTMKINPDVKDIFSFRFEDFTLENYNPHPHIKGVVSV